MPFNPFKILGTSVVAVFSGKANSRQYINVFFFIFVITAAVYAYVFVFSHGKIWTDWVNKMK